MQGGGVAGQVLCWRMNQGEELVKYLGNVITFLEQFVSIVGMLMDTSIYVNL